MITLIALKKSCNDLLKQYEKSEGIKTYGNEVIDGFERPSFFTELISNPKKYETKNFLSNGCSFKITYFQKIVDEVDQLNKVDEIQELFGMYITVGKRKLRVTNYQHDFAGENNNILQITIDFEFMENISKADTHVTADSFSLKTEKESNG